MTSLQSDKQPAFAALHHRNFRFFFVGTMLAMLGDNIEHVVSYWLLFQKFHSPALGGFAEISHWTPFLFLSVYFGALADRYDCRKVIQAAQVMFMGVSLVWAMLFYTNTIQVWHAGLLLIVHGIAGAMWSPAEQLVIHDIVGTEHLQSAVRLNATSRQLGILFGPAVGAGLMLWLGPPLALVANVVIYLPLTIWLLYVPYTGHFRKGAPPKRSIGWADAIHVLREVAHNRPIVTMIVLGGSASFLGADHRAASGARRTARPADRSLQYVRTRPARVQRGDGRHRRRSDWDSPLVGFQRNRASGCNRLAFCVRRSTPIRLARHLPALRKEIRWL